MWISRKTLGLAFTSRAISVVEIDSGSDRPKVVHAAEFPFPEATGLDRPASLGKELKEFLGRSSFTASRCVIGIEAKWLTARQKALPPHSDEAIAEEIERRGLS